MLNLTTLLAALPLVLGYLGALHPALDSFSHFRIYALGGWIVWLIVRGLLAVGRARYGWWMSAVLFGVSLGMMVRPFAPESAPGSAARTLTHLQYNINLHNPRIDTITRYILDHRVDVVTLQEVTHAQERSLRALAAAGYRWQAYCMRRTTQEAIISRHPFVSGSVRCETHEGLVSARIRVGGTPITVASVHLFLPFPYGQQAQVERLRGALAVLRPPVLIAGDFNAAPWSHTVEMVAQASRTRVVPGLRMTIPTDLRLIPHVPLPIDQVLVSPDLEVARIAVAPHMGSDHWPLIDRIVIDASASR